MSDPYALQLEFIQQALPQSPAEHCHHVFYEVAKRDIRKAIFYLLQPATPLDTALAALLSQPNTQHLEEVMQHYCPNTAYQGVVHNAAKGLPFPLEKRLLQRLQTFKRAPRTAILQQIWKAVQAQDDLLVAYLKSLRYFSHELAVLWPQLNEILFHPNPAVIEAALQLLPRFEKGIVQSLPRVGALLRQPEWQFRVLQVLQQSHNLPSATVRRLIQPIVNTYRHQPTKQSELWAEFRLIQSIARNNGVRLTLPDINLGRF